jgi:hypothetical protein
MYNGLSISNAARHLMRQIRRPRHQASFPVPKLAVTQKSTLTPPTAWFICPDFEKPSGGVRKLYRSVDILNAAGLQAAIVHERAGLSFRWFEHKTRVVSSGLVAVNQGDVIVVPEVYGGSIRDLPRGIRQVIFNQGAYLMLDSFAKDPGATAPYIDNPDLAAVLVVSEDSAAVVKYAFPGISVRRVRQGLDRTLLHPPTEAKLRRISYMPRRRAHEAACVLELLKLRGVLHDWEVIAIDRRTEAEVADLLRTTQIFLSFSQLEGFGLPALEALACGCLVVGYHGFGGREFFRRPFAIAIEDGDMVAFARAVEGVISLIDSEPTNMAAAGAAGASFVQDHYSLEAERDDLLDVFVPLLKP